LATDTQWRGGFREASYTLCPETTNTVRVWTLVDPDTNEPSVACAVHRFGTPETNPTDNWSRGGLLCACDLETGTLGPGVKDLEFTGGELRWHSHHPNTGCPLEGVRVPLWEEVREALAGAIRALPLLVYVGWDVVVTDEGFTILEGNNNPDIEVQVFGGLLKSPRVRRFYEYHKVV